MTEETINLERLHSISRGDKALEQELFKLFNTSTEKSVGRLSVSQDSEDSNEWAEAAHELKGTAANIGATRLFELCKQAEAASKQERQSILDAIEAELEKIKQHMEQLAAA